MKILRMLTGILGITVASAAPFERAEQKQHLEALIDATLPFAELMLKKHQEFFPYGAAMSSNKEIRNIGGYTGEEHPPSLDIIDLLRKAYKKEGAEGKTMACALAYDIRTIPPGKSEKTDAVAIELDHRDGMSIIMIYPYKFSPEKVLIWGDGYAVEGKYEIFGKK